MNSKFKNIFKNDIAGIITSLLIVSIILSIFTKGFTSAYNVDSLGKAIGIYAIVGMAQLMVLAIGQFNLAIGAMGSCAGMLTGALLEKFGVNIGIAIICGVLLGFILGYLQGLLIVKTGINPFIITLALTSVYLGTVTTITRGELYRKLPDTFKAIGKVSYFKVPLLFIIAVVIMIILWFIISRTTFGRKLLATGVSFKAADYAGINSEKMIILAHAMSGLLAGIAGVLTISRLGAAQISVGGNWMLISFAAPVLGGTLLSGGKVSVVGTILGAMLMSIITNGLVLFNINAFWFQTFIGVILLVAFGVDKIRLSLISKGISKGIER